MLSISWLPNVTPEEKRNPRVASESRLREKDAKILTQNDGTTE